MSTAAAKRAWHAELLQHIVQAAKDGGMEDFDLAMDAHAELLREGPLTDLMHAAIVQASQRELASWDFGSAVIGTLKRRRYIQRVDTHEESDEKGRKLGSYVLTGRGLVYFHAALKVRAPRLMVSGGAR